MAGLGPAIHDLRAEARRAGAGASPPDRQRHSPWQKAWMAGPGPGAALKRGAAFMGAGTAGARVGFRPPLPEVCGKVGIPIA